LTRFSQGVTLKVTEQYLPFSRGGKVGQEDKLAISFLVKENYDYLVFLRKEGAFKGAFLMV